MCFFVLQFLGLSLKGSLFQTLKNKIAKDEGQILLSSLGGTWERAAKIQLKILNNVFQPTICSLHPREEEDLHLGARMEAQPVARLAWGYWLVGSPAKFSPPSIISFKKK